jgi:hypothetical protein
MRPGAERMDTSGFHHGLRVRMGARGPKGMLLRCERRDGTGFYWKVRLNTGEWVWPEGLILEGPGTRVGVCEQCALPFMTDQTGDGLLCPRCDEEIHGTRARAADPTPPRRQWDVRRRHR